MKILTRDTFQSCMSRTSNTLWYDDSVELGVPDSVLVAFVESRAPGILWVCTRTPKHSELTK